VVQAKRSAIHLSGTCSCADPLIARSVSVTSRERIEKTWDFEAPDSIPFEFYIMPEVRNNHLCARVLELTDEYSDNWSGWGPFWGWFGLEIEDEEELLEEGPATTSA